MSKRKLDEPLDKHLREELLRITEIHGARRVGLLVERSSYSVMRALAGLPLGKETREDFERFIGEKIERDRTRKELWDTKK